MICPHCSTAANFEWSTSYPQEVSEDKKTCTEIAYDCCPNCKKLVVFLHHGVYRRTDYGSSITEIEWAKLIYPKSSNFVGSEEVPPIYLEDYEEAIKVLPASPKASAALSRRLLQSLLREEFKIKEKDLSKEIESFIVLERIPTHLTDAVDAIINIGNFAAHPLKDKNTGEIVPVEKGEAEWLIEVIESLFDFIFIQPKKLKRRREELNIKLEKIGKPPLKKKN